MGLLESLIGSIWPQYDLGQVSDITGTAIPRSWEDVHALLDKGNKIDPNLFDEQYVNQVDRAWERYQANPNDINNVLALAEVTRAVNEKIDTAQQHQAGVRAAAEYGDTASSTIQNLKTNTSGAVLQGRSQLDQVFGDGSSYADLVKLVQDTLADSPYSEQEILKSIGADQTARATSLKNEKSNIASDLAARGLTRSGIAASLTTQANAQANKDLIDISNTVRNTLTDKNEQHKALYTGILGNLETFKDTAYSDFNKLGTAATTDLNSLIASIEGNAATAKANASTAGLPNYSNTDIFDALRNVGTYVSDVGLFNSQLGQQTSQQALDNILSAIGLYTASKKGSGSSGSSGSIGFGIPGALSFNKAF